jgi:diacylglycerol kinase family enzyme
MKYYFIMNPGSKGGNSQKKFTLIHQILMENHIEYDYEVTKNLDDAYTLSVKANEMGYDVIVAVGGDGTINRVLNGFYDKNGKRKSKAKFGVIYTGTSPDFCKSYNIPLKTDKALYTLIKGNTKSIGIGKIDFRDNSKYFACCANIGLGATLARYANSGIRKYVGDKLGTFLSLIKTLCTYKPITVKLSKKYAGDEEIEYQKPEYQKIHHVYNISIGKTYYVASGLKIKSDLKEGEPKFYMLTIKDHPLRAIYALYSGKKFPLEYSGEITIEGEGEVEFDGDEGGILPCTISLAENIEVICEGD